MFGSFLLVIFAVVACASSQSQESDRPIKVITFNVRNSSAWSTQFDGIHCWENRKNAVAKMIEEEHPDAIGLQEALNDQVAFMDSLLTGYQKIGVGRDDGDTSGECMAVYFNKERFSLERSATYWLSETPQKVSKGWDGACRRTVTMALLEEKSSGMKWLYMNTHLDHVGPVARAESIKLLTRLAEDWAGKRIPVVIGGDMNSTLNDTIFRSFYAANLFSARNIVCPDDTLSTYNAYGKGSASQIDHFFVRGIQPKRVVTMKKDYGVPYISDHYPVLLEF